MALVMEALVEILRRPTFAGVMSELLLFCAPLWAAVAVGLLVGWAWKPKWAAGFVGEEEDEKGCSRFLSLPKFEFFKTQFGGFSPSSPSAKVPRFGGGDGLEREGGVGSAKLAVTIEDLKHLWKLVEVTDGGPVWMDMMERSLPTMSYKAWRRDPETGPPQYRSSTIFEDATPEIVRDFFWDDEHRTKLNWDDMLLHHEILEECLVTGTMIVHWVRKFPFFCSDREYIIGRRIWELDGSYYCVTKGVRRDSVPRKKKPRRVDLYYSSWCIRAVKSEKDNGQRTACEILLFHHEDMGIPWEIAKLGVRQGMWGCVKKIEPGLRAYQKAREANNSLSRCAFIAHINTKVSVDYLRQLEINNDTAEIEDLQMEKPSGRNIPKLLLVGGAVALACTLDRGLLTKAVIFGVARRFAKRG